MTISAWLQTLCTAWQQYDIETIGTLFADDVMYYETPFEVLTGRAAVLAAWEEIHEQENIQLQTEIFCGSGHRHAITWDLHYTTAGQAHHPRGTYLVELDDQGLCTYFQQCCEYEI